MDFVSLMPFNKIFSKIMNRHLFESFSRLHAKFSEEKSRVFENRWNIQYCASFIICEMLSFVSERENGPFGADYYLMIIVRLTRKFLDLWYGRLVRKLYRNQLLRRMH